jgi:hypothetical protein
MNPMLSPEKGQLILHDLPGRKEFEFRPPVYRKELDGIKVLAERPDGDKSIIDEELDENGKISRIVLGSSVFWDGGMSFETAGAHIGSTSRGYTS